MKIYKFIFFIIHLGWGISMLLTIIENLFMETSIPFAPIAVELFGNFLIIKIFLWVILLFFTYDAYEEVARKLRRFLLLEI